MCLRQLYDVCAVTDLWLQLVHDGKSIACSIKVWV